MGSLSIGDVARQAGVAPSTIRYYEKIDLLTEPVRINGRRAYGREVLGKLSLIQLAKAAGYSLEDIRALLYGFDAETPTRDRWRTLATGRLTEIDEQIAGLQRQRAKVLRTFDCRCASLVKCAEAALP